MGWGSADIVAIGKRVVEFVEGRARFIWNKLRQVTTSIEIQSYPSLSTDLKSQLAHYVNSTKQAAVNFMEEIRHEANAASGYTIPTKNALNNILPKINAEIDLFCASLAARQSNQRQSGGTTIEKLTGISGNVMNSQITVNDFSSITRDRETAPEKGVPPSKEAQAVIDWARTQAWAEYEKLLKEAKEESRIPLQELHRIKSESEARARAAEGLPGFIFFSVIEIRDVKVERRKYLFDFGKMDRERLSIYISKDGIFTLCLNDAKGEPHLVQVPLGKDAVPISTRFHLGCEVGVGASSTFLRLLVDGNEKGSVTLPFKIDLGKLDSNNGVVGTDLNHKNGSWFDIHMDTVFTVILTKEERTLYLAESDKFLKSLPDKPYLRFNGDQYMIFGNLQNPNSVIPDDSEHKPEFVKP